jgi:phosphoribosylamine--glycine ligase
MTPTLIAQVMREVLQPAVDGMCALGTPYVGVLYAGLMITDQGPRVLEFNCRFGDPEAQVILPLLQTDLLDVIEACMDGRLTQVGVRWQDASAACIVLASGGYPDHYDKGKTVVGIEEAAGMDHVLVFHAGTRREGQLVVTSGGRVLGVAAVGPTLASTLHRAYTAVEHVSFEGMHYRRDIGAKGLMAEPGSG